MMKRYRLKKQNKWMHQLKKAVMGVNIEGDQDNQPSQHFSGKLDQYNLHQIRKRFPINI